MPRINCAYRLTSIHALRPDRRSASAAVADQMTLCFFSFVFALANAVARAAANAIVFAVVAGSVIVIVYCKLIA